MNPEVPQALRLQAILASGICILYKKQAEYLLEDCETTVVSHVTYTFYDILEVVGIP